MAKADVKMPDEFLARISRLGAQTDSIAEKVLQAGGEVAIAKVKSNLKSVVGSGTKANPALPENLNVRSGYLPLWSIKTAITTSRSAFPNLVPMVQAMRKLLMSSSTEQAVSRQNLF